MWQPPCRDLAAIVGGAQQKVLVGIRGRRPVRRIVLTARLRLLLLPPSRRRRIIIIDWRPLD